MLWAFRTLQIIYSLLKNKKIQYRENQAIQKDQLGSWSV